MNPFVARSYGNSLPVLVDGNLIEPSQVNGDAAGDV